MKVRNINGTSQNVCKCGSWLAHWVRFSGHALPPCCPARACFGKPEVGAHVQKDGSPDESWYIVPLCQTHNGKTGGTLDISDYVPLVSANVSLTCG